ncbi:MAG TPA: rod-binding protein [Sedimentisphaerales bacterium]|nr:rod-binding protein [Sedimentisphaerales bacterium]
MAPVIMPLTDRPALPAILIQAPGMNESQAENRKVEAAKGFESLLIGKLLDAMKETVGESGLLEDEGSEQMQAMFWMHLSGAISEQGGFGLWKDIYKSIYGTSPAQQNADGGIAGQLDRTI